MNRQNIVDALFTSLARSEEKLHPRAVLLPNFPPSIQLDYYSCGAKSTYMVLKYFGKRCTPESVERQLGTEEDGTSPSDIKRVFKQYGLQCRTMRKPTIKDLKAAIDAGCPVLISLYEGEHYVTVYGHSRTHMFVMNPSLDATEDGVGSVSVAIPLGKFQKVWDRWGIVVKS
jgi:ABC-type bacteriocin/lantibiotic exporter with double-glycine peptidase domain